MPTKTALNEQQSWEVPSCSLPPAPSPNSWQRKQVAASSRLFLSFLFVTGVSVSNICWPELASSCCAGLWQGRAEEPGACAKHGAWLCRARPAFSGAVPAVAGHGLRVPGRVCSAPPAFSGPSSHKWQRCWLFLLVDNECYFKQNSQGG